jgi:Putative adhesin
VSAATRWTVAGLALAVLSIGAGTSTVVSLLWTQSETVTHVYPASAALSVSSQCGSVTVDAGGSGATTVRASLRWSFGKPVLTETESGGTTRLKVRCPLIDLGVGSALDLRVTLPSDTVVTVSSSAGDVDVTGLSGALTLDSSAGSIVASGLSSARVSARSSAGDVQLAFVDPPQAVVASSSAGGVTVLVPRAGVSYQVDSSSSAGSTDVAVPTDPQATRTIRASSSAGDVTVGYAS